MVDETEDQESAIARIQSTKRVKKIWPLRRIKRDPGQIHSKLPGGAKLGPSNLAKRDSKDSWSTHAMTGVDKLHAKGLTGKGTFVAILDTGVDYKHPDLGGGFGPGFKVAKGYDFVGDNAGFGNPKPDDDPYESCGLHGTWVSGIVAANSGPLNAPGVAPEATLGMYRVFDCFLWTSEDIVISAYLKAYDDGADVISLSFGAYSGVHDGTLVSGASAWALCTDRIFKIRLGELCQILSTQGSYAWLSVERSEGRLFKRTALLPLSAFFLSEQLKTQSSLFSAFLGIIPTTKAILRFLNMSRLPYL